MNANSDLEACRKQLHTAVQQIAGGTAFADESWQSGRELFQLRSFAKGDWLVHTGEPGRFIFFLCRGLVRLCYANTDGREFNKSFAWEDMFVAGALNPASNTENQYGIEALEPGMALAISLNDFSALLESSADWRRVRESYIGWLADRKTRRERQLLLQSAEDRYRAFLSDFPAAAGRIPQRQIALYLGITEVALSRIKKRAGIQ